LPPVCPFFFLIQLAPTPSAVPPLADVVLEHFYPKRCTVFSPFPDVRTTTFPLSLLNRGGMSSLRTVAFSNARPGYELPFFFRQNDFPPIPPPLLPRKAPRFLQSNCKFSFVGRGRFPRPQQELGPSFETCRLPPPLPITPQNPWKSLSFGVSLFPLSLLGFFSAQETVSRYFPSP